MWESISVGAICLLLVGALLVGIVWGAWSHESAAKKDDRAGLSGSKMLREAHVIFDRMQNPNLYDNNATFLSTQDSEAIDKWQKTYYGKRGPKA
jgi:hypothetical protein